MHWPIYPIRGGGLILSGVQDSSLRETRSREGDLSQSRERDFELKEGMLMEAAAHSAPFH